MTTRSWLPAAVAGGILCSWLAFAHGPATTLIESARNGQSHPVLNHLVQTRAGNASRERAEQSWLWFADAAALAGVFWFSTWTLLRAFRKGESREVSRDYGRPWAGRLEVFALAGIALVFLGYTVYSWVIQDYYHYLAMWREILLGNDPWFLVHGVFGTYPLNAYGPLFNAFAIPARINPLFPKLIFATAYVAFACGSIHLAMRSGESSIRRFLLYLAWFWNPFVWVEIAHYGHFDVLVGLMMVAALEERARRRDLNAGTWLGLGVLLKYMPLVLLPFLMWEGRRIRCRLLGTALGVITLGMAASYLIWGPSTIRPLVFAATRGTHHLSIYRYMRGQFAPIWLARRSYQFEPWSPLILFLALLRTWSWSRERDIQTGAAAAIAVFVTVLFYQVGFPQYQMLPFVLASWWLVRHGREATNRRLLMASLGIYFGWISVFDLIEARWDVNTIRMEEWAGLPTFVLGGLVVFCLVRAAPRRNTLAVDDGTNATRG